MRLDKEHGYKQSYETMANPFFEEPLRILHKENALSRAHTERPGMARAGAAARVGTDALITAVARQVWTGPAAAVLVTSLALKQPGAKKAGVVVAPVIGLVGGTVIGAAGGVMDVAQAGWFLGVATPANVTVATLRRAFKAMEQTIDDMFTEIREFVEARPAEAAPAAAADPQPHEVAQ